MSDEDDFDLNDLDDKELVEQIQDDLYDGLDAEVTEGTNILLARGWDANDVLGEALVGGMKIVGIDFRDGILFVPEVFKVCRCNERRNEDFKTHSSRIG